MTGTAPLSVGDLSRLLGDVFRDVGLLHVEGEISQMTRHRSGHWYFTLRDRSASVSCVMFRGTNQFVRQPPVVGETVVVTGTLDFYAPQGRLSFLARKMQRAGEGDLAARLEALKKKLHAEGLFAEERKRSLPALPRAIGIATSPTGAALRDILSVLEQRFPGLPVYLAPCRVQGAAAPMEIAAAVARLNEDGRSDVLIVGRGGGSAEDLAAFNDEGVARAIAASRIPVVSAVGHEIDVSIADLVADRRAATPSHAAEIIVPERDGLLLHLDALDEQLRRALQRRLEQSRSHLAALRLRHPAEALRVQQQRLDAAASRLRPALNSIVSQRHQALSRAGQTLAPAVRRTLGRRQATLDARAHQLSSLGPHRVLERGYAIVLSEDRAVTEAASLHPDSRVRLVLHSGEADAVVTAVRPPGSPSTS